jgi:capsular exopolysaccharide synthesis family protein
MVEPLEQPDYIETQYKVLQSRSLAKRVIAKLGLAARPEFAPETDGSGEQTGAAAAEPDRDEALADDAGGDAPAAHPVVVEKFQERLGVHPGKGTRLVDVSFESIDRELAPRVANALAEEYIEHNLAARWNATQKASRWLQQQLSTLLAQLESSEAALQDYAARHSILFVEERKNITTEKLAQFEDELTRAEASRIEKQSMAMLVEDALRRGSGLPGSLTSEIYQRYQGQLAELRREESQLLVTFAPGYPKVKRISSQLEELDKSIRLEERRILDSVSEQYHLAQQRETLLRREVLSQRGRVNRLSDDFIQYNILKRDAETNRQLYDGLLQRLKEAGISAGLRASNVAILDAAEIPRVHYRPRSVRNLLLALLGGLAIGVSLAFAREHMNTVVRTPDEVERLTGLGLLAVIPRSRSKDARRLLTKPSPLAEGFAPRGEFLESSASPLRLTPPEPASASNGSGRGAGQTIAAGAGPAAGTLKWEPEQSLSEAYRTLRSSVLLGWDESMRRLLVTSSQPQEGKTTVSLNLACSLAQLGRKVAIIDADMRRPACSKHFGLRAECGLSEYLQGLAELDQVLMNTPVAGLSLIAAGRSNTIASDLLYSPRLATLLQEAGTRFDHVVIDSPPSLVLSDARTISRLVEGVLMVVSDETERNSLLRTKQMFDDAGVRFLGFVMNRVDLDNIDYGYYREYGYGYRYADEPDA